MLRPAAGPRWAGLTVAAAAAVTVAPFEVASAGSTAEEQFKAMFNSPLPGATGRVEDARCDVEAVELANAQQLHILLDEVMATPFFSLFRVNMHGECKFW